MYQTGFLLTRPDRIVTSFDKLSGWGTFTSLCGSISTSSRLTITSCSIEFSYSPSDIKMVSSVTLLSAIWSKCWKFLLNVLPFFCFYYEASWFFTSFHYSSWFPSFTIQHADFFTNVKVFQWSWMLVIIFGLILLILLSLLNITSALDFIFNFSCFMVELISMFDHTSVEPGLLIHQLECFLLPALPSKGLDQNLLLWLTYS